MSDLQHGNEAGFLFVPGHSEDWRAMFIIRIFCKPYTKSAKRLLEMFAGQGVLRHLLRRLCQEAVKLTKVAMLSTCFQADLLPARAIAFLNLL